MRRVPVALLVAAILVSTQLALVAAADPKPGAFGGSGASVSSDPAAALADANDAAGGLGIYFDSDANQYVAVFPSSTTSAIASRSVGSIALNVRIEYRSTSRDEVTAIIDALTARKFALGADNTTFGTYFDPRSGMVVIDTTGAASLFAGLIRTYGDAIDLRASVTGGRQTRANDSPPHWGGAEINSPLGGCTSGYSVKKSNGQTFMVTAAHCANLSDVITGGTGLVWGDVSDRGPFPAWDVELITGTHGGSIYSGDATGVQQHVKGGAAPVVGSTSYCISGRTSHETCGHHAVSLNGTLCDPSGCTPGLVVYNDGTLTGPGDSGAPWYNYPAGGGVTIRGSHVGRIGSDMYAENFALTKAHWSLTILTS
jgi:hypothetical protein